MKLNFLENTEIDYQLWDSTIELSPNHLIYAHSWYLDIVNPNWCALVTDDYSYVLPLTVQKRFFLLKQIILPVWIQQLGIFSKQPITKEITESFIQSIISLNLPVLDYPFNYGNHPVSSKNITLKPNYVLELSSTYMEIAEKYNKNTVRNLKKAAKFKQYIKPTNDVEVFIKFIKPNAPGKLSKKTIALLKKIIETTLKMKKGEIWYVHNDANEWLAATFLLIDGKRIIYRTGISSSKGKTAYSMFLLIDHIINHYSNRGFLLDFEGSSIDGVARFYKSFGAVNQPYFVLNYP